MKRAGVLLLLAFACQREPSPAPPSGPPVTPQAAVQIEPPRLRLGDVAAIDVVVVTPPGYRVHPIRPPASVPGLWLLDAEVQPIEQSDARLVQRTRIRARARETGSFEWPGLRVEIEDPSGARSELATAPRPIEIVSVLPSFPERVEPFSYRMPVADRERASPLWAAAAGSAATLALLAGAVLARRARRRAQDRASVAERLARSQPWVEARAALDLARAAVDTDWIEAGGLGARALRRYVAQRFGIEAESLTSEEVLALARPFGAGTTWSAALACLRDFDAERFRARSAAGAATQVRDAIDAARRFVDASLPPEAR